MAHDSDSGWKPGSFSPLRKTTAFTFTTAVLTIVSWRKSTIANSGWYDGAFSQSGMPGSQVATINWGTGSGLNIRVYFQIRARCVGVSVCEWQLDGWTDTYSTCISQNGPNLYTKF
jgi:hypothetical protein